jgi:hypothetical protein
VEDVDVVDSESPDINQDPAPTTTVNLSVLDGSTTRKTGRTPRKERKSTFVVDSHHVHAQDF